MTGADHAAAVALYFVGAVTAHIRAEDPKLAPSVVMLVAAVAALVLRATTT